MSFISETKSFINIETMVGDRQSPCVTLHLQSNHSVSLSVMRMYEVVYVFDRIIHFFVNV